MPKVTDARPYARWFPRWLKPLIHGLLLLPLLWYGWAFWNNDLGANPIEALTRALGDWGLGILLASLAVTPIRRWAGWTAVMRLRRMVGLWGAAYALLHVAAYVGLDQFFDWPAIYGDILKRTYITLGMGAFVILLVLAVTSLPRLVKALGGARWRWLHRSVYAAAVLSVLHYFWMVKADLSRPSVYAVCLVLLLLARLPGLKVFSERLGGISQRP